MGKIEEIINSVWIFETRDFLLGFNKFSQHQNNDNDIDKKIQPVVVGYHVCGVWTDFIVQEVVDLIFWEINWEGNYSWVVEDLVEVIQLFWRQIKKNEDKNHVDQMI